MFLQKKMKTIVKKLGLKKHKFQKQKTINKIVTKWYYIFKSQTSFMFF